MQQGFLVKSAAETEAEFETMDAAMSGHCISEQDETAGQRGRVDALASVLKESMASKECGPITGRDRNLCFHGSNSSSFEEESTVDILNPRHSSFDEPRLGAEAPVPTLQREGKEPTEHATLPAVPDPCSAQSQARSLCATTPSASQSSRGSSTSGEECDLDESYPHHKKFRMHRKRPAVFNASKRSEDNSAKPELNNNELPTVDMKKCKIHESHEDKLSIPEKEANSQNAIFQDSVASSDAGGDAFEPTIDRLGHAPVSREASPFQMLHPMSPDGCNGSGLDSVRYAYVCQSSSDNTFQLHDQITANSDQAIPVATNELHECRWLQCTRKFLQLDDLVNHVNDAHIRAERDIDYKCYWENCPRRGKGFNARYKMLIHVRTHTNERPYKCNLCSKSFSRLENLKIHNRSHTGERPYVCPFEGCNKAYSNSSDRFKHVRTHQEQKPYCCRMPGCDKRYTDPSSLRKHIKTHGHYFRPASEESRDKPAILEQDTREENASPLVNGRSDNLVLDSQLVKKDFLVPSTSALTTPPSYLSKYSHLATHPLLPHTAPVPLSLNTEDFRQLRVREDFQQKALLEGSLLSALSLPRPPLLSLAMPFAVTDATCYSLNPSSLHGIASHLPATSKSFDSHLTALGSAGSLSPGNHSDSHSPSPHSSSAPTDSESSSSPLLSRIRPVRSAFDSPVPSSHDPYSAINVSVGRAVHSGSPPQAPLSPAQTLHSAFSPVTLPYPDKYSFLSPRSAFVSRPARHSPTHHPYARPPSRSSQELISATSPSAYPTCEPHSPAECPSSSPSHTRLSPKLSPLPYLFPHPRPDRPLDLSNPSSPEMLSDREGSPRMSPPSPYHTICGGLPTRCHQPPKCDLGPAFPALHLLNHA